MVNSRTATVRSRGVDLSNRTAGAAAEGMASNRMAAETSRLVAGMDRAAATGRVVVVVGTVRSRMVVDKSSLTAVDSRTARAATEAIQAVVETNQNMGSRDDIAVAREGGTVAMMEEAGGERFLRAS